MGPLPKVFAVTLLALAGCQTPAVDSVGNDHGGAGGAGAGGTGGQRDNRPDFTVTFPDGGARDAGPGGVSAGDDGGSCAGELHEAKLAAADLLFLLDTSGSMEESAGPKSKWMSVRNAIESFVADPQSVGLGVGLETFPVRGKLCQKDSECGGGKEICGRKGACAPATKVATAQTTCYAVSPVCLDGQPCTPFGLCSQSGLRCTAIGQRCPGGVDGDVCTARARYCTDVKEATCAADRFQTPSVPIAELPGARPAIEQALLAIVPEGGTPTTPAVKGALGHLRARASATPARKQVLVLATDGMPTLCEPDNTVDRAAAELSAAQAANPAVSTYVIGVFSAAQLGEARPALEQLAAAGGTGAPLVLDTGADLTQQFIDAINQIRGSTLSCDFAIPAPQSGSIDYDKVNVRLTTTAGNEDLLYVGGADRCDPLRGGWYYDVDPRAGTPTRVLICEASCRKVKVTVGLTVGLRFGCKTIVIQ